MSAQVVHNTQVLFWCFVELLVANNITQFPTYRGITAVDSVKWHCDVIKKKNHTVWEITTIIHLH